VSHQATHNQLSVYEDDAKQGFFKNLNFSGPLEEEFRQFYSHNGVNRARLMPGFMIFMSVLDFIIRLSEDEPWLINTIWNLGIFIPLLVATLYTSTLPDHYRLYQKLLAASGLAAGLVVVSINFNPTLEGMPSYFTIEVTWILVVWLILGLRFLQAAIVALMISCIHIITILYLGYEMKVLIYEIMMLFLVSGIGASCCYQYELTARRSYIESLELEELTREFKELAMIDGLTGLNNRRTYDVYIDRLWRQSLRENTILAIILVDIDHFKAYNDHYGHQGGDDALKAVANVIAAHAKRPLDFAARYGGEEFVLALHGPCADPDLTSMDVLNIFGRICAESLREDVAALQIPHDKSSTGEYLTVSVGVAVIFPGVDRSLTGAVQMADEALYQAKNEGRNRVVISQSVDAHFRTGRFRVDGPAVA